MAEYEQTGLPCTSNKYYITWLRFRWISGSVPSDSSGLVVKGRRKLRLVDPTGTLGAGLHTFDAMCGRRGFELRFAPKGTSSTFGVMLGLRVHPRSLNVSTL